jgi:hypothetical protein
MKTDDPANVRKPACPNCKKARKQRDGIGEILTSGRPPAIGGNNPRNKAMDAAAEMVMEDYGMTDIKAPNEIREGDSQAPKLPPAMQRAADNMFSPKRALDAVGMGRAAPLVARAAMGGSYSPKLTGSPDPISAAQLRREGVMDRTTIINEKVAK